MTEVKEVNDEQVTDLDILAETVAMLSHAIQVQNDVLIVLMGQLDLKLPDWKTKKEVEEAVGSKIQECVKLMRNIYGHGEVNKG